MAERLDLPVVDLASADHTASSQSIRKACLDHGFFYITNHGIGSEIQQVFHESKKFFSLPLDEKLKLQINDEHCGYTPPYAEKLDSSSKFKGDLKESFYIGPAKSCKSFLESNQWPSEEILPLWSVAMVSYYEKVLTLGKHLLSLIALSLQLDKRFFETIGALDSPNGFIRMLHYPGELKTDDYGNYGASAHSDYGMITLLATDGVPGLQICREKDRWPQLWEDVPHIEGAFIVNVGDLLERWTNCLYRSTLHRVVAIGKDRHSVNFQFIVAYFLDPNPDCMVECLESCCSEAFPPRFLPIRSGDYLKERISISYSNKHLGSPERPSLELVLLNGRPCLWT